MVTIIPEMADYNTEGIIKFLDEKFPSLNDLRVTIFGDNPNNKLVMNLTRKLYACGCHITLPSTVFSYSNGREVVEHSDVTITFLNNHEINETFHPYITTIIDITGDSFNEEFMKFAKDSRFVSMYTSK